MSFTGDDLEEVKEVNLMSGYLHHRFHPHSHREPELVRNLLKFLAKPPHETVTSLKLAGLWELEGLLRLSSPENTKVWTNFAAFWYLKLICLEVDNFDNFLCPIVLEISLEFTCGKSFASILFKIELTLN